MGGVMDSHTLNLNALQNGFDTNNQNVSFDVWNYSFSEYETKKIVYLDEIKYFALKIFNIIDGVK
jgi:hypothetical protein